MRNSIKTAILTSFMAGLLNAPAAAAPEGEISYVVNKGDVLYTLGENFLLDRKAINEIRRINRIRNPRRLQIGQVLKIPRQLLKSEPVDLTIQSFAGRVMVKVNGRDRTPAIGQKLGEGDEITTGANGFISIAGTRSSRVTLPTNSHVRIIDARRYLINGAIDVQLKILGGRGEVIAPELNQDEKYRIGTPTAVTAVRGTHFRVAFDQDDNRSLTEVLEGQVVVTGNNASTIGNENFGVAVINATPGEAEKLLPAPTLVKPGKIQTEANVEFTIIPLSEADGYRTQISKDAGFIEMISEAVQDGPQTQFTDLADGRYFVRARGIAASGLEGNSEVHSFRRKRIGSSASVEKSPFGDAFKFAWRKEGEGQAYFGFQLWNAADAENLLVDEVAMEETAVYISDLDPGKYNWRVATFLIDENEIIKVWSPTQAISVTE